jgi:hypothetical protein
VFGHAVPEFRKRVRRDWYKFNNPHLKYARFQPRVGLGISGSRGVEIGAGSRENRGKREFVSRSSKVVCYHRYGVDDNIAPPAHTTSHNGNISHFLFPDPPTRPREISRQPEIYRTSPSFNLGSSIKYIYIPFVLECLYGAQISLYLMRTQAHPHLIWTHNSIHLDQGSVHTLQYKGI